MDILIGQTIEKVEKTERTFTIWTKEGLKQTFDITQLFGYFCKFGYFEVEELIGQTITKIEKKENGFRIYGSKKNRWSEGNEWCSFYALGVKEVGGIKFSKNKKEMMVEVFSYNSYGARLIYYYSEGKWNLSEFCEYVGDQFEGIVGEIDLLTHSKIKKELEKINNI